MQVPVRTDPIEVLKEILVHQGAHEKETREERDRLTAQLNAVQEDLDEARVRVRQTQQAIEAAAAARAENER